MFKDSRVCAQVDYVARACRAPRQLGAGAEYEFALSPQGEVGRTQDFFMIEFSRACAQVDYVARACRAPRQLGAEAEYEFALSPNPFGGMQARFCHSTCCHCCNNGMAVSGFVKGCSAAEHMPSVPSSQRNRAHAQCSQVSCGMLIGTGALCVQPRRAPLREEVQQGRCIDRIAQWLCTSVSHRLTWMGEPKPAAGTLQCAPSCTYAYLWASATAPCAALPLALKLKSQIYLEHLIKP